MKRAKKIVFNKESLLIVGLFKKEFIPFKEIYKFEIFKDGFFYEKTLGIKIHFRNGSLKKNLHRNIRSIMHTKIE